MATAYTTLGLGDIYQRRQDEAETQLHGTWIPCARCRTERRADSDWYPHRGHDYCEDCYLQILDSEEEIT